METDQELVHQVLAQGVGVSDRRHIETLGLIELEALGAE